jgi:hypothetical protein
VPREAALTCPLPPNAEVHNVRPPAPGGLLPPYPPRLVRGLLGAVAGSSHASLAFAAFTQKKVPSLSLVIFAILATYSSYMRQNVVLYTDLMSQKFSVQIDSACANQNIRNIARIRDNDNTSCRSIFLGNFLTHA